MGSSALEDIPVLLLQAGKASAKGIDAAALKTQIRGVGLPKGEVKALKTLIDNAAKTLDALDKFTGRDIAVATGQDIAGYHQWDTEHPAGRAIQAALDAQAALSEKMRSLINAQGVSREAKAILETSAMTCDRHAEEAKKRLLSDPGVTKNDDGTYTLDASKFQSPELNYCLMYTFGIYSNHAPTYIDRDLYERLQTLKAGPARDAYLADLKKRLSPAAYDAAVKRLDDAIARADDLRDRNRVYGEADWNDRDKQKAFYHDPSETPPALDFKSRTILQRRPRQYQEIQKGIVQMTQGNYRRNGFDHSAKRGWFD